MVSFVSRLSRGRSLEDQLRGEERKWPHAGWSVWGHACMPLFTMPSKGGHAGTFEVRDHPAGSLQTCRCWTFMPLAESYSIFIRQLMWIFEGGTPRNILCLAQLLREGSPTVLGLSTLLLLWCFNLTLWTPWICGYKVSVAAGSSSKESLLLPSYRQTVLIQHLKCVRVQSWTRLESRITLVMPWHNLARKFFPCSDEERPR